ncbi:MAG: glycerol acyltransferase, partial [Chlorobi bacterium]|nr:glycerol acyltransferase [Chlorobiota bacterium]
LVYDIGKINKMFKVYRKGTPKELLKKTIQLSEYIRYTIFNKKQSVWIAQRGGRTKDGFDKTQTGIIKMLNSSGSGSIYENIKSLNVFPLSISYEFEPNDYLKVNELLNTKNGKYIKAENEDLNSIIEGIRMNKGRIHLAFGKPINDDLKELENISRTNEKIKKVAEIIDNQIYSNYKLWPNNYIAADVLNEDNKFSKFYSEKEKENFINYKNKQLLKVKGNKEKANELFLKIYANPVFNCVEKKSVQK